MSIPEISGLNHTERRRVQILERRAHYLRARVSRVEDGDQRAGFDRAEIAALDWAVEVIRAAARANVELSRRYDEPPKELHVVRPQGRGLAHGRRGDNHRTLCGRRVHGAPAEDGVLIDCIHCARKMSVVDIALGFIHPTTAEQIEREALEEDPTHEGGSA